MRNAKRIKQDNRGVTLIELMVAITILAIVMTAGMAFFTRSLKLFNRSGRETTMQNEAQLTATRLQSLIVNATHGVSVVAPNATPSATKIETGNELYIYNREDVVPASGSAVTVYKITHIYQDGKELKYCNMDYTPVTGGNAIISADKQDEMLLTDKLRDASAASTDPAAPVVGAFRVDLTDFAQTKLVKIEVDYENFEQSYLSENQFLLRNAISTATDGSADDYFKTDVDTEIKNQITALEIPDTPTDPAEADIWQGNSMMNPFTVIATLKSGGTRRGASVVWSTTGGATGATIDATSGTIRTDASASGIMSVIATYVGSDHANINSNAARVYIKEFSGVSLTAGSVAGTTYEATFTVSGKNLQSIDVGSPSVAVGSTIGAAFEEVPLTAKRVDELTWKVKIQRPAEYDGRSYTLNVSYTLNGQTKNCSLGGIKWESGL